MIGWFDAEGELEKIRALCMARRRRRHYKSALDPYRAELVALRRSGATYAEMRLWLLKAKHKQVAVSTVQRYLAKLPESPKVSGADTLVKSGDDGGRA
ncbi:hypothetical protein [Geomonas anaerohicana]|uniref:Transposase n=1 Tax=Geomonas anaerohicana TaxID=2798583 RepID=A0ABS0YK64_9BACT|nr:hypothetical protein [Geomonas anaerohicana]MBJ6752701.1 hypothetical protein [Geomonas anaerohicana]